MVTQHESQAKRNRQDNGPNAGLTGPGKEIEIIPIEEPLEAPIIEPSREPERIPEPERTPEKVPA